MPLGISNERKYPSKYSWTFSLSLTALKNCVNNKMIELSVFKVDMNNGKVSPLVLIYKEG